MSEAVKDKPAAVAAGASQVAPPPAATIEVGSVVTAAGRAGMGVVVGSGSGGTVTVYWPLERLEEWRNVADLRPRRNA